MKIQRLTEQECYAALNKAGLGRLACARDNQPYVVPIYFVVGDGCLYSFALPGQKVDWMRMNPRVCIEADAVGGGDEWTSVIAFGLYEELSDDPEHERERALAHRLLQRRPMWWQPGAMSLEGHIDSAGYVPIFFRVSIESVSGYRGVPAAYESAPASVTHDRPH